MSNELVIRQDGNLMPALSLDEAARRYNMVVEYTKKMMTEGKDYGAIPGTGDKPTLLKPGAEKLCSLFGLYPDFETLTQVEDFGGGLFFYRIKCTLYRNGEPVASGVGSCNSKEKKYRYRYIYENKASDEEKAAAVSIETKSGKYGNYKVYKVENSEPFELVNTIDKMAQKRALVAATLIGANASEFFTQDVEDMGFVDGDFTEVSKAEPKPQPKQKSKPAATADPGSEVASRDKEYDFTSRPYDPDTLKAALEKKVATIGDYDANEKQRNLLGALLNEFFQDDQKRHTAQLWLTGSASVKDMSGAYVKAMLDWLHAEKDDSGAYVIDDVSRAELSHVITSALIDEGQEALL